jgi:hypothetical protein
MLLTIHLIKPLKDQVITYSGELLWHDDAHMVVRTVWTEQMGRVDMGFVAFEPGDYLYEHFYSDRWYNVFELHAADGRLKGWYCNITRPAIFAGERIESEDLELDLFVSPDRSSVLVLDEEEYAARQLDRQDPAAHEAAQAALATLRDLAERGEVPFQAYVMDDS